MSPQLITEEDHQNYGSELVDMTKRAALEALGPELNALRAENNHLRGMAQRAQHVSKGRSMRKCRIGMRSTKIPLLRSGFRCRMITPLPPVHNSCETPLLSATPLA
jgi:hypothetical protein